MSLFYRVKEIASSKFHGAVEIYEKAVSDREIVMISGLVNKIQSNPDRVLVKKKENRLVNLWS